jgi:hypothetical protein
MTYSDGYARFSGTAEEVIAELEERATAWHHMASDRKRDRAREAAQSVRDGSCSVKVGNTIYNVVPAQQAAVPDPRTDRDETADNTVA